MLLIGRRKIYTPYEKIDDTNVLEVVGISSLIHFDNAWQEEYLINYVRGVQPILGRIKEIRPEINNKIVENHAYEIMKFKTGYLLPKPIDYIARKDEVDGDELGLLNDYMGMVDKESKDKETVNMMSNVGVAVRGVFPNPNHNFAPRETAPFKLYNIDPRTAFVVYSGDDMPIMGVVIYMYKRVSDGEFVKRFQCYTDKMYYEIEDDLIIKKEPHILGMIPIIEYPNNDERMGDFEPVIPLLDAINLTQSNRLDGVEQFIQSLLVFKNVDIDDEAIERLRKIGAIKVKDNGELVANVSYLVQELNQEQVQKLVDCMYDVVLRICGMPQRNGGSSTSDTGSAVYLRDGWGDAETRACDTELVFKTSERVVLKLAIKISRGVAGTLINLYASDIEIKFTRRNYENILQKAQVLTTLLSNDKIAPRLAFVSCGLFNDPESAYEESYEYYKTLTAEQIAREEANKQANGGQS